MSRVVAITLAMVVSVATVATQTSVRRRESQRVGQRSDEQQIRALIQRDATQRADDIYLPDALIWTGANAHPHRADEPDATVASDDITVPGRTNVTFQVTVNTITVSSDMAWEHSSFALSYDDRDGHKNLTGALLRVWQRQNSSWKVAALFQRPFGRVVPVP